MKAGFSTGWKSGKGPAAGRGSIASVLTGALFFALIPAFMPPSARADVVINELMYHPEDGWHTNAAGAWVIVTNETEYIEIYNSGPNAVDLSTYRFDNGITYDFPQGVILGTGVYVVVCQNMAAFKNVYTNVQWTATNCMGNYKGGLNNGGERVTLSRNVSNAWVTVDTIKYTDGGLADGHGCSLELVHPGFATFDDQFHGAWAASTNAGTVTNLILYAGTPGRVNSLHNQNAPPVIGDVIHDPALPPPGSSILITCRPEAKAPGMLDRVKLLWRWDQDPQTNAFAELRMYDDGLNGDAVAGNGKYSRVFPPYGYATPTSGQLLEFRIVAIDQWGGSVTSPVVSAANTTNPPYSYLCYFGNDAGFSGEYTTYHILMTGSNKVIVEAQGWNDDGVRLDGTFITSDGEIFYNCGVRHRGGQGSTQTPYNYKVRFQAGRDLDGLRSIDLNHVSAMYQYIGMKIMGSIGYGVEAPNVKLCRVWLNEIDKTSLATVEANHKMYVRHEPVDQDLAEGHYGSDSGNFYTTDRDTYNGFLDYFSTDVNAYTSEYNCAISSPSTAWRDLTNMIWIISQVPSAFMTTLTNRIDPREWGRYFGGQMSLDNNEAGVNQPPGPPDDELRLYMGSENGMFHIIPHDCDAMLGGSSDVWGWNTYNTADVINNPPTVKFYRHDCLDIASNVMSDANMNALFDDMGSAAATFRGGWLSAITNQRNGIHGFLGSRDAGPVAPTNLVLTNVAAASVKLQWQDVGTDEEWFEIWRSKDGSTWKYYSYVESNVTSYVNIGLDENTEYFYKVRAVDQHGESAFTVVTNVTTPFITSDALLRNYLRVTEIMYNPTNAQEEFIELMNTHESQDLTLSFVYFTPGEPFTATDGTSAFTFTNGTILGPGKFLVLVRSVTAFTNRYPGVSYYGWYDGKMDDDKEQIRMRASNEATFVDFTYNKDSVWCPTANTGYSLVLWDPPNTTNDPTSSVPYERMEHASLWRPSTHKGGSPGSNDPSPSFGVVVVNEVLSHQDTEPPGDWIELYNPNANAINIGYWCLSDDATNLAKFQIPPGTIIGSNGCYVFTEYWNFGTNTFANWTNGFGISELGDRIYLSSGKAGGLTSYRVSEDFVAGEKDVTFGRYRRSDGEVDFVAMSSQTSNGANAYPLVGPIVINEIMYNPSAGGKEYVELYNLTNSSVPLFDVANPTNTWNFDGAMDFTFPTNTYLGSHQYALVVGMDTNEFKAMFGITNPAVQVFGPYGGELANGGESIKLYKPGTPETNGFVPRIRVDRVQYDDAQPWPAGADNGGASLERRVPSAYGNDPTNWVAGTMFGTPGGPNNTNGLPTVNFAATGGSGCESNETVKILVTLTPAATNPVSVWYTISAGTATPNVDYAQSNGVMSFAAGTTSNTVSLAISNDAVQELDETVLVTLTNVSANKAWLGGNSRFTWTIVDTDGTVLPPIITPNGTNMFTNSVSITIATNGPTSAIYYTKNGAIPDSGDKLYTGAVVLTESTRITAKAYLGSYMTSSWTTALFLEQAPPWETDPHIGEIRVCQNSDDGYEAKITGIVTFTNTAALPNCLPLGRPSTSYAPWTGVRFDGIGIGRDVVVTNAYIKFTVYQETTVASTNLIWGHLTNDALTFETNLFNISSRPQTTSSVPWTVSGSQSWKPVGASGTDQQTPNLASLMNEVLVLPGWKASNAMVFVFSNVIGGGRRLAYSYDGSTNDAPMLYYWTAPQTYWLGVLTNGYGTITNVGGNRWVVPGSTVDLYAVADQHYQFAGWTGSVENVSTAVPNIQVIMTNSRTMWGNFADILWTNGVPEAWLEHYYPGTSDYNSAAMSDTDVDGHKAWQENVAGTDPTNKLSVLRITTLSRDPGGSTLRWPSVTGKTYSVFRATNLLQAWGGSFTNYTATSGTVSCTDSISNEPSFYRIRVQ